MVNIDVPNSHWLIDFFRGVSNYPELQQLKDDDDGIPVTGPAIFLPAKDAIG